MSENAFPDINPASADSLEAFAREMLTSWFRNEVSNCLPATVVSYDRTKNRAVVAPAIPMVTTVGAVVKRAPITVPVFNYGGGGFVINFPLKPGDTGFIRANDRDISLFLQNKSPSKPNTARLWSFEDSIFYPDVIQGAVATGDALVIQKLDGLIKLEVSDASIKMQASGKAVTVTSAGITIDGDLTINGSFSSTGDGTIQGKSFADHTNNGYPVD